MTVFYKRKKPGNSLVINRMKIIIGMICSNSNIKHAKNLLITQEAAHDMLTKKKNSTHTHT